jgi:hypothetical protein
MKKYVFAFAAAVAFAAACDVDTVPAGLRATPPGDGPVVRFELTHRPLPEIPFPNDLATFADPTSRTGRRINASMVAPTAFERASRQGFDTMEGFGTSSPIAVSFDREPGSDPREPAIDLEDVARRMQGDEFDLSNDPVYLVNLTTGVPMIVDAGNGMYPVVLRDPWRYMPNDPKASESNLAFETVEEGAGLPQSAYKPALDMDFDGVLDHPNTMPGKKGSGFAGVDDLLTWYERETDTLILRPALPLEEKTEYAVVLTDRLRSPSRKPVRSPFDAIHHPSQRRGVARLADVLANKGLANYYGDIAGTGLEHVAFAWTFTTQPTHEDMTILRDGLYGHGPFARFAAQFPAEATISKLAGVTPYGEAEQPGWETSSDLCKERAKTPYLIKLNDPDVRDSFDELFKEAFGLDGGDRVAVQKALENVDHLVVGRFKTPFLLGDPASRDENTRFHVNFQTGEGDVRSDEVQFFISVPKTTATRKAPFPVAFWGHGVTGHADEVLFYAGDYAKQGIALFGYNNPEHGLTLAGSDRTLATARLSLNCLVPFLGSFDGGRAHDLNGDGEPDSGWFWWTAHVFHTRDNVRQGILDGMQAVRILRTFDGHIGTQDYNGDGKPDPVGDFDGDGVPDVGGPNVPYFAAGESLGGIMSGIQGGIEPYMIAAAPMSGGGPLAMDVAMRSYGVTEAVTGQLLGPVVFAVPATERAAAEGKSVDVMGSRCAKDQDTVRIVVNEGDNNHELEIACLSRSQLDANRTVVVTNVATGTARCARTGLGGRFRVPIPTTTGDKLDIQIYDAPDVVQSYDGCRVLNGAPVGRRIDTWEQAALWQTPVGDESKKCDAPGGCAQFRDTFFPVGSALVAPNDGLGLRRQSPEFRRFRDLAQAVMDPADPFNYAPYYMLRRQYDENGAPVPPHALLNINTVGDNFVQVSAGYSFGRAAGAIPFLPPSALGRYPEYADYVTPQELYDRLGRKTPMQFLIDNGSVEGIPRLGRTTAGPGCAPNYKADATLCTKPPSKDIIACKDALYDPDWVSEGGLPFDQPHPQVPLRLGRVATSRVVDSTSLAAAWEPRLRGVPFSPDDNAWSARERVVAQLSHYLVPQGKHTWDVGDVCQQWDYATYGNALTARFFASEGKDLYYLSHPRSHGCLVNGTCDFMR